VTGVVDRRVRSQKISIVVLLEVRGHVGLPRPNLFEPIVLILLVEIEALHVAGGAQLVGRDEVRRRGGIENEVSDPAAVDHGVNIEDVTVGGVEPDQRLQRARIQLRTIVCAVEKLPVQIPVYDASARLICAT
jgi:hypothetical protein